VPSSVIETFPTCYVSTISGTDSMGHGGHVPPLLQMAGHGTRGGHRE